MGGMTVTLFPSDETVRVEHSRLEALERVIERTQRSFYDVGKALEEIRDRRLYRRTHRTFEAYCRDVWDMSRTYAYQLMRAAAVVDNVRTISDIVPSNERQARLLARLPADEQRAVWKEVVEQARDGRVVTRHIQAAIWRRESRQGKANGKISPIIKPSDNWNFHHVFYPTLHDGDGYGYIPGDLYANCFWYYARPGDLVVDPMAGSGTARVVYEDRRTWMGAAFYDFELQLFDLTPQKPYIGKHNLLDGFPVPRADYIIMDIPYFGIARGQYSDDSSDIANMDWEAWRNAMAQIALHCATAQEDGGRCTVITPNFRDLSTSRIIPVPMLLVRIWHEAGYELFDVAYASRRIQQAQTIRMAMSNLKAKQARVMLTDISEVLTFVRCVG